ncbi:MAG: hypothetical protein FJ045_06355 [Crenarchaeota archaeon]|nr:hypothetical protein [Thermoproteota archaeon]
MRQVIFCTISVGLFAIGCQAPVAFYHQDRPAFGLTHDRLQNLQFQISGDIVLQKILPPAYKIQNGRLYEDPDFAFKNRIVFSKGTRGLVSMVESNYVAVNFEADPYAALYFVANKNGLYVLGGDDPKEKTITYSDQTYQLEKGHGVHLLYYRSAKPVVISERQVPGRALPNFFWAKRLIQLNVHSERIAGGSVGDAPDVKGQPVQIQDPAKCKKP